MLRRDKLTRGPATRSQSPPTSIQHAMPSYGDRFSTHAYSPTAPSSTEPTQRGHPLLAREQQKTHEGRCLGRR